MCAYKIVDITTGNEYRRYLHKCMVGPPSKRYKKRIEYLERAIPNGFHKRLLISNGDIVGQIEYAPAKASYYLIRGNHTIVMNCIWVLRRVRGPNFGKKLLADMIANERRAAGFATIALENQWSPWFKKQQIERLGFTPRDAITVSHKRKPTEQGFSIHLMRMPNAPNARPPTWDKQKLLEGLTACIAHPLCHPQTYEPRQLLKECTLD